jgi:hypothetical protein
VSRFTIALPMARSGGIRCYWSLMRVDQSGDDQLAGASMAWRSLGLRFAILRRQQQCDRV